MDSTRPLAVGPVYDVRCVSRLLHAVYKDELLTGLGPLPELLPGFITFFDPGWSIAYLRDSVTSDGKIFYPQTWYDNEPFAKLEEPPRYQQLQMETVKDSFDKTFAEQQTLVQPGEKIPTARVVLMALAIHFLATGERLFSDCCLRCVDQTAVGHLVDVGNFGLDGVYVNDWDTGSSRGALGIVLARQF